MLGQLPPGASPGPAAGRLRRIVALACESAGDNEVIGACCSQVPGPGEEILDSPGCGLVQGDRPHRKRFLPTRTYIIRFSTSISPDSQVPEFAPSSRSIGGNQRDPERNTPLGAAAGDGEQTYLLLWAQRPPDVLTFRQWLVLRADRCPELVLLEDSAQDPDLDVDRPIGPALTLSDTEKIDCQSTKCQKSRRLSLKK